MSEPTPWINLQAEELNGGAQSSQDTLCSQNFEGYENRSQNSAMLHESIQTNEGVSLPHGDSAVHQMSDFCQENYSQNVTEGHEPLNSTVSSHSVYINEDAQMMGSEAFNGLLTLESPYNMTSPGCEPGDISSPFEAMESDGLNDTDDFMFSSSSTNMRRRFQNICPQDTVSTTTPGGSSDDDPYSSSGSRKKRRRTKKEMHPSLSFTQDRFKHFSHSSQISPVSTSHALESESDQTGIPQGVNLVSRNVNPQTITNTSDPSLFNQILEANRRLSNASESNQSSMNCSREINGETDSSMFSRATVGTSSNGFSVSKPAQAKKSYDNVYRDPYKSYASLQAVYPSSNNGCSLDILVQPEEQHRARYLTEGSRGPVKDRSQQDYPQIQLKGYTGKTTLSVFVGSDSDDKVRPHGFYQACKVTGRNTTSCEEVEIEGTKVIRIPFDAQDVISVDCVGILKLRNADVEFRIGANRAKKRSQTVRLVFRVALDNLTGLDEQNPCILQVVSQRINCTQPRGQPEITKKSLERCSVEGNQEMFIIGRNFHKGTKVIFQDSEEPDKSHWHTYGTIDRDTFNQSHLVVRVPAYHDQAITKSVNVQLCVEFNGRKCDPHSFTYDPSPTVAQKEDSSEPEVKETTENTLKNILDNAKIDRKVLEALFAQLFRSASPDDESKDVKPTILESSHINSTNVGKPLMGDSEQLSKVQQMLYVANCSSLSSSSQATSMQTASTPNAMINITSATFSNDSVLMTSQQSNPVTSGRLVAENVPATFFRGQQQQNSTHTPMLAMSVHSTFAPSNLSPIVKTEAGVLSIWPDESVSFPNGTEEIQQQQARSGSFALSQHATTSMSDALFSLSQSANHVTGASQAFLVSVNQSSRCLSAVSSQTEANRSTVTGVPQPANTLRQEMTTSNTTLAPASNYQSDQIRESAPDLTFNENFAPQTSSSMFETTFSMQQDVMTQASVTTSGFNPQASNVSMQQGGQWLLPHEIAAGHNRLSSDILLTSSAATAPVQQVDVLQWHSAEQQASTTSSGTFHNDNKLPGVQLQHSSSGELSFCRTSDQAAVCDIKQQGFTIGDPVPIVNSSQPNSYFSRNLTRQEEENNSFQNTLALHEGIVEAATLEEVNMLSTLSPTTGMGDTGLSIGFDNNFNLNDSDMILPSKVMDRSVLQTIISDCTNSSFINPDDSSERDLVDHKLQDPLPQSDLDLNAQDQVPNALNTSANNFNINDAPLQVDPQLASSPVVDAMPAVQMIEKQFASQAQTFNDFIAQPIMDTNLYLVNPNDVHLPSQEVARSEIGATTTPPGGASEHTSQNQQ